MCFSYNPDNSPRLAMLGAGQESPLLMLGRLEDIGRPEAVAAGRQMPPLRIRGFNFTSLSDAV